MQSVTHHDHSQITDDDHSQITVIGYLGMIVVCHG